MSTHSTLLTSTALALLTLGAPARSAVLTTALARATPGPTPMLAAPSFEPPSFAVPSLTLAAPLQSALASAPSPVFYGEAALVVPALVASEVKNPDARRAFTPVLQRLAADGVDTPAKISATPLETLHLAVQRANTDVQTRLRDLGRRVFDGAGGFSAVSQNLGELRDIKSYGSPYLHNTGYNAVLDTALEEGPKNLVKRRAARRDERRLSAALGLTLDPKLDEAARKKLVESLAAAQPLHAERVVLHRLRGKRGGVILVDLPYDAVAKDQIRMLVGRPGRMIETPVLAYDTYGGGNLTVAVTALGTLTIGEETGPRWNEESLVEMKPGRDVE